MSQRFEHDDFQEDMFKERRRNPLVLFGEFGRCWLLTALLDLLIYSALSTKAQHPSSLAMQERQPLQESCVQDYWHSSRRVY